MAFAISLVIGSVLVGWYLVREVRAAIRMEGTQSRHQDHAASDWQEDYYHDPFDGYDAPGTHGKNIRG